jgi:hypothetical protein
LPTLASLAILNRKVGVGTLRQPSLAGDAPPPAPVPAEARAHELRFVVPVMYGMDIEIPPALPQAAVPGVVALVARVGGAQPAAVPILLVREPGRPSQHFWWANLRSEPRVGRATAETRWYMAAADWRYHVNQTARDVGAFPGGCGQMIVTIWCVAQLSSTGSSCPMGLPH